MRSRAFAFLAALCGTLVGNGSVAPGLAGLDLPGGRSPPTVDTLRAAVLDAATFSPAAPAANLGPGQDNAEALAPPDVGRPPSLATAVPDSDERPSVSLFSSPPMEDNFNPAAEIKLPNGCLEINGCIDDYLWSFYQRTPKVDTNKVAKQIRLTLKKKGKRRTVIKTISKYIVGDFTWKDPVAAQRSGMSIKDYVIGGMDRSFKLKLYYGLRAMEEAGLMPGITSAFRDDYRQSIASGRKAASDSSYHGGSRRGGYGHGMAADLVSVKGDTRQQRYASSVQLWKWIDAHEQELGIGRPYLDRDPPHVGPIDGEEYAIKRRAGVFLQSATTQSSQFTLP
jgi:hypothetical protein